MTAETTPQLALTRIVNAPRARVYKAFTNPDDFAVWWGPFGNSLHAIEFDVRPGGSLQWRETFPDEPDIWTQGQIDLIEVVEGELLAGIMRITGELPGGYDAWETRMRFEFHDEDASRTRLEIRQWLPKEYVAPVEGGWSEQFAKLDALLAP